MYVDLLTGELNLSYSLKEGEQGKSRFLPVFNRLPKIFNFKKLRKLNMYLQIQNNNSHRKCKKIENVCIFLPSLFHLLFFLDSYILQKGSSEGFTNQGAHYVCIHQLVINCGVVRCCSVCSGRVGQEKYFLGTSRVEFVAA